MKSRAWGGLRSLLLCGLGGLGAGLVLGRILGFGVACGPLWAPAGMLGAALGFLSRDRRPIVAALALGASMLLPAAAGYLLTGAALWAGLSLLPGLLGFGAAVKGSDGFYGPLGIWSVGLGLLALALYPRPVMPALPALSLLLTLDGFRDQSLRKGLLTTAAGPAGLGRHSLLLTAALVLGGILAGLALLGLWHLAGRLLIALGRWLLYGTGMLGYQVARLIGGFFAWLFGLLNRIPDPGHSGGGGTELEPWDLKPYDGGSSISTLLLVILTAAGALLLLGGTGVLLLRGRRRKRLPAPSVPDYVEEREDLPRPSLRSLFHRNRKPRLRDYRGPMLVRYAFQNLLKQRLREGPGARYRTPNELRREDRDENLLIDAYNTVRYARGQISPEALAAAERVAKKYRP